MPCPYGQDFNPGITACDTKGDFECAEELVKPMVKKMNKQMRMMKKLFYQALQPKMWW